MFVLSLLPAMIGILAHFILPLHLVMSDCGCEVDDRASGFFFTTL